MDDLIERLRAGEKHVQAIAGFSLESTEPYVFAEAANEITRLRQELAGAQEERDTVLTDSHDRIAELHKELAEAQAALTEAVKVIEPFAEAFTTYEVWGSERDWSPLVLEHAEGGAEFDFTIGHLRAARDFHAKHGPKAKEPAS